MQTSIFRRLPANLFRRQILSNSSKPADYSSLFGAMRPKRYRLLARFTASM